MPSRPSAPDAPDPESPGFGLHERLRTPALERALANAGLVEGTHFRWEKAPGGEALAPLVEAHLARVLHDLTAALRDTPEGTKAWSEALERLVRVLSAAGREGDPWHRLPEFLPSRPLRQLLEVMPAERALLGSRATPRPDLPLAVSALLTGSARTPSLQSQLEKELASADRVDWLVSFIKWSGIRPLRDALRRFVERGDAVSGPRLRIATTSYLGATDLKAIAFLLELPRTEVRVSFDTHRTRLHAKAFLFHRRSGFGSAYVGSANVSRAALDEGLEWTAKIAQHELPWLWRQVEASFAQHWEDESEFELLSPTGTSSGDAGGVATGLARLEAALRAERRASPGGATAGGDAAGMPLFDLRPYGFQEEILEEIAAERSDGKGRHLVVAATGTGKTMVAAFDYRRYHEAAVVQARAAGAPAPPRPSLLFLAHREEILKQSLGTFRQVLRDPDFGGLLVGGNTPGQSRHLFASVQSWASRGLGSLRPDHFDYVVLDEAHHAAAESYQAILDHLRPRVLLGLTATPERADGGDIRKDFGHFTHELRLPDAVERRLLAPFHYFGIADEEGVDFSNLNWRGGRYASAEVDGILGANEARARWVYRHVQEMVTDPEMARGLGFCVSQNHAHFMARRFSAWGVPSVALTAETPRDERARVQRRLVNREIRFIFTVDLFNEGVDIPEVDTVLLLRPTESLTVYLQQLGRGLRLHPEKAHLTVLDFIAPQHRRFRFADRYRALSRNPGERVDHQVEAGFPYLPSGCLVKLDRRAMDTVLENIRETLGLQRRRIVAEFQRLRNEHAAQERGEPALVDMLDWLHVDRDDPDTLLRRGLPHRLLEEAGAERGHAPPLDAFEKGLTRGLRTLAMTDDRAMLEAFRRSLDAGLPGSADPTAWERVALAHVALWGKERPGGGSLEEVHAFVRGHPGLRRDLLELLELRIPKIHTPPLARMLPGCGTLQLHARYTREQVLLALGEGSFAAPQSHREGVLHVKARKLDAFFVTIRKSEARFSPSTMYHDFATSERTFHWQSQSTTRAATPTGQRYVHHLRKGYTPLLFVREVEELPNGLTAPFHFLGALRYLRHEGDRPMSITWELETPMPARVYRWANEKVA